MAESMVTDFHNELKQHGLTATTISLFQDLIWNHYRKHGRRFPWRETHDPYSILVSEIMLQQTQTSRVVRKYNEFLSLFPNFFALARAPLRDVLQVWQGLGYNRRALALQQIAQRVVTQFGGRLPSDPQVLRGLPGVGPYTAAAVVSIAFNNAAAFVDTNIRSVFLQFFFRKTDQVSERDILNLVESTLDKENPREWYYALFDYGAMIKRQQRDITRTTKPKTNTFQGSNREIRGQVLRLLLNRESITEREVVCSLNLDRKRVRHVLVQLQDEGFIEIKRQLIRIK